MTKPYVIINCAMSADGKIALPTRKQLRISSEEDIKRMYLLRNECDAVLVGVGTILSDDPKLTVKEKYVKNPIQPIRIILDTNCMTPKNALAVNEKAKTIIFSKEECKNKFNPNVEIIKVKVDKNGVIDLKSMLEILSKRGIKKLMVEGGGTVIWNFLRQDLVDEMYVYVGPIIIGGKDTPTLADGKGIKNENEKIPLDFVDMKRLGPGVLIHYKLIK
jgi:2,5-diamino-6-(ribosylamino)-4(3H)-pyrimidinone 5'-phosphate reductase